MLAAGALDWPVYPELRRAFTAAMQPEQSLLLGEERNLLKFTEQTARGVGRLCPQHVGGLHPARHAGERPHSSRPAVAACLRQDGQLHARLSTAISAARAEP